MGTQCVPDLRILLFLPIQAFARLITQLHVLQNRNHLLPQALRLQHDDVSAMVNIGTTEGIRPTSRS